MKSSLAKSKESSISRSFCWWIHKPLLLWTKHVCLQDGPSSFCAVCDSWKNNLLWKSNLKSMQLCWDISTHTGDPRSSFLADDEGWLFSRWNQCRNQVSNSSDMAWSSPSSGNESPSPMRQSARCKQTKLMKTPSNMIMSCLYKKDTLSYCWRKKCMQQLGWTWYQDLQCVIQPHNW